MYSTFNEGKSVVAERFVRTLKNKIYKHMTAISKNVYFDVLDDIVDKYTNTYHRTIKMSLLKDIHVIGVKKFLLLKKTKNTVPWTYIISDLNGEEIVGS